MKIPVRQCSACHNRFEKNKLIRVVRKPDGTVEADKKGRLAGRGVYICRSEECLNKAIKTRALSRALESEVTAEVFEQIRQMIKESENG